MLALSTHCGTGYAVQQGMLRCRGEYCLMLDVLSWPTVQSQNFELGFLHDLQVALHTLVNGLPVAANGSQYPERNSQWRKAGVVVPVHRPSSVSGVECAVHVMVAAVRLAPLPPPPPPPPQQRRSRRWMSHAVT